MLSRVKVRPDGWHQPIGIWKPEPRFSEPIYERRIDLIFLLVFNSCLYEMAAFMPR
jgi:hypothetical protein